MRTFDDKGSANPFRPKSHPSGEPTRAGDWRNVTRQSANLRPSCWGPMGCGLGGYAPKRMIAAARLKPAALLHWHRAESACSGRGVRGPRSPAAVSRGQSDSPRWRQIPAGARGASAASCSNSASASQSRTVEPKGDRAGRLGPNRPRVALLERGGLLHRHSDRLGEQGAALREMDTRLDAVLWAPRRPHDEVCDAMSRQRKGIGWVRTSGARDPVDETTWLRLLRSPCAARFSHARRNDEPGEHVL